MRAAGIKQPAPCAAHHKSLSRITGPGYLGLTFLQGQRGIRGASLLVCRFWGSRRGSSSSSSNSSSSSCSSEGNDRLPVVEPISIPPPPTGSQYAYPSMDTSSAGGGGSNSGSGFGGGGSGRAGGRGGEGRGSGEFGGPGGSNSGGSPGNNFGGSTGGFLNIPTRIQSAIIFFCWFTIITCVYTFIRKILLYLWHKAHSCTIPNWSKETDEDSSQRQESPSEVGVMPEAAEAWLVRNQQGAESMSANEITTGEANSNTGYALLPSSSKGSGNAPMT